MKAVYTDQEYISASAGTTGKSDLYGKERYLHSSVMTTMFFSIAAELSKRGSVRQNRNIPLSTSQLTPVWDSISAYLHAN